MAFEVVLKQQEKIGDELNALEKIVHKERSDQFKIVWPLDLAAIILQRFSLKSLKITIFALSIFMTINYLRKHLLPP